MPQMEIKNITHLPPQIFVLEKEAVAEGFGFISRLIAEWQSGANRFDGPGECFLGAYLNQRLVGVGGLSVDPYTDDSTARVRRVYVSPAIRGNHVGQKLVSTLIAHAVFNFRNVRLYTDTPAGSAFYLRCGFMETENSHATHIMLLENF